MSDAPHVGWRGGGVELRERVAEGPFAEVWRAETVTGEPRPVAVKFARGELGAAMLRTEFELSAGAARAVSPPLLAQAVYSDLPYLVRAWCPGTLRHELDAARSPDARARLCGLTLEAFDLVARLHAQGVVHGDLKPENVLIDEAGRPRLIDFGLAQHVQRLRLDQPLAASLDTRQAPTGGTLGYMAPELIKGDAPSLAADVYALGVILHEVLLGRRPGTGGQADPALAALPPGTGDVLTRALAYAPRDRPATARALLADLFPVSAALVATGARRRVQGAGRLALRGLAAFVIAFRYSAVVALLSFYVWGVYAGLTYGGGAFLVAGCGFVAALGLHWFVGWAGPSDAPIPPRDLARELREGKERERLRREGRAS